MTIKSLNFIMFRGELYGKVFEENGIWPNDALLDRPLKTMRDWARIRDKALERLYERKALERPEGTS